MEAYEDDFNRLAENDEITLEKTKKMSEYFREPREKFDELLKMVSPSGKLNFNDFVFFKRLLGSYALFEELDLNKNKKLSATELVAYYKDFTKEEISQIMQKTGVGELELKNFYYLQQLMA